MSIAGIGIDIVDIERFKNIMDEKGEKFAEKVFTREELEYFSGKKIKYIHMAGKFAAKEAVKKALPNGAEIGLNWSEIEILNQEDGKPYARLHGRAKKVAEECNIRQVIVSVSHTKGMAVSNALVVKNGT